MSHTLSPEAFASLMVRLNSHVISECREVDVGSSYDEMLDDCYSLDKVGGPFSGMSASRVLREVDPVCYRCGMSDYLESQRDQWVEIEGNHYEAREAEEAKEAFLDELRNDLEEIESEITELEESAEEGEPDTWSAELAELNPRAVELRDQIAAVEAHSF